MNSERLRILHVLSSLHPTEGGTVAGVRMAAAQAEAGCDVAVLAACGPEPSDALADELAAAQIPLIRLAWSTRTRIKPGDAEHAVLRKQIEQADIVHAHGLYEAVLHTALRTAQDIGRASVLSPHGMLTGWALRRKRLKKWLFRRAVLGLCLPRLSAVHFATPRESEGTTLSELTDIRRLVVPLPMDFARIDSALPTPVPSIPGRVVSLGRIVPGKGVMKLVEGWSQLMGSNAADDAWTLEVIGDTDGPYARTCRERADALGLGDRIAWAGRVEGKELFRRLAAATLFAQPSEHENFGQAALEAAACGTPALLSPGVAIAADMIEAGVAWKTTRQPRQLAADLAARLGDPEAANQAGQRAVAWARSYADPAAVGRRWVEALRSGVPPRP